MWTQRQVKRTLSTPEGLACIRARVDEGGLLQRTQLADALCADLGFHDARGWPQRASCLAALRDLEAAAQIELPAPRKGRPRSVPSVPEAIGVDVPDLACLGTLELVRVNDEATRRIWTQLLHHEHPRGAGPFFGPQLQYLIRSEVGWLAAVGFAAAARRLKVRDAWIGWDDPTCRHHPHRVVNLSRF